MSTEVLESFLERLLRMINKNHSQVEDLRQEMVKISSLLEDILQALKEQGRNVQDLENSVNQIKRKIK